MRLKIGVPQINISGSVFYFLLNIYKKKITQGISHLYFIHYSRSCGGTSVPSLLEFPWGVACDIWKNWTVNDDGLGSSNEGISLGFLCKCSGLLLLLCFLSPSSLLLHVTRGEIVMPTYRLS